MKHFTNVRDALRYANTIAPAIIGWRRHGYGPVGFVAYPAKDAMPDGVRPELFVLAGIEMPVVLSPDGAETLATIFWSSLLSGV